MFWSVLSPVTPGRFKSLIICKSWIQQSIDDWLDVVAMTCTRVHITCTPRCRRRPADATMTKLISYNWFRCFFVFFGTSRYSVVSNNSAFGWLPVTCLLRVAGSFFSLFPRRLRNPSILVLLCLHRGLVELPTERSFIRPALEFEATFVIWLLL